MAKQRKLCILKEQSEAVETLLDTLTRDNDLALKVLLETPERAVLYHAYANRQQQASSATDIAESVNALFETSLAPQQVGMLVSRPDKILSEIGKAYEHLQTQAVQVILAPGDGLTEIHPHQAQSHIVERKLIDAQEEDDFADALTRMQGKQTNSGITPSPATHIPQPVAIVALQVMEAAAHLRGDKQTEQRLTAANREIFNNPNWNNFLVEDIESIRAGYKVAAGAARSVVGAAKSAWKRWGRKAVDSAWEAGKRQYPQMKDLAGDMAEIAVTWDKQAKQQVQTTYAVAQSVGQRAKEDWQIAQNAIVRTVRDVREQVESDMAITRAVFGTGSAQSAEDTIVRLTQAAKQR